MFFILLNIARFQLAALVKVVDETTGNQIADKARLREALGRDARR
jgi:hypothetical protein